jgi:hypothetical protein
LRDELAAMTFRTLLVLAIAIAVGGLVHRQGAGVLV